MIKVEIKGLEKTLANIAGMQKQVRFATAVALTKTAKQAEARIYEEMRRVFDRPTPFTMKSLRTKTANKNDLTAMVYVKDREIRSGYSAATIFKQHYFGGDRQKKQMERALLHAGFINDGEYIVPGAAAKMDRYGNIQKSQLVQILSQIGYKMAGYDSNPTNSKRSKRNVAKAGTIFWSHGPSRLQVKLVDRATGIVYGHRGGKASSLPKGAWLRVGNAVKPMLLVVRGVNYRRRLDLAALAQPVVDKNFQHNFDAALADALRTAR